MRTDRVRIAFKTLGCRLNQYETEVMKERLRRAGFTIVEPDEEADLFIINTCTVTARAEAKARQYIHRFARRGPVLVTGCWATVAPEEALREGATLVFGNAAKLEVVELVWRALAGERGSIELKGHQIAEERIARDSEHTRAFVKVQDGCDRFCTYCRTIFARGRSRSKPLEVVVAEVKGLVRNGYREVVLTGIDLADYMKDPRALPELLWALDAIPGLERIRLSSLNPQGVTPELAEFFRESRKACPYFHIPLQSGDDALLRRMNRGYTVAEYREKVALLREEVPNATFGADVMVGFPGETEESFERTCKLVEEVGFIRLHIFRYSPRPGTAAARFPDQVPEGVKRARLERLRELGREVGLRAKREFLGRVLRVLVEEQTPEGHWRGWTENYLDVHLPGELRPGQIIPVRLERVAAEGHLYGRMAALAAVGVGSDN